MELAIMSMSNVEHALKYARMGLPVFPLHNPIFDGEAARCTCARGADCGSIGKHPRVLRGFKEATTDERAINEWWARWPEANIAIPTGEKSGWAVIDLDVNEADGKDGPNDWKAMEDAYGPAPSTLQNMTGGGGQQLIFRHVPGFGCTTSKLAKGIDTRGDGGYIVVPPSMHGSGKAYEWSGDLADDLAELPKWVLPLLNPPETTELPATVAAHHPGTNGDGAVCRCRAYLALCPPSIQGQRGSDALLRVACECARFGLGDADAMDLIREWNGSGRAIPPWSEKEMRHKWNSATKKVQNEGKFGCRLTGDMAEYHDFLMPTPTLNSIATEPEPAPEPEPESDADTFPQDLLEPPGLLGEIVKYINSAAIRPQPILALANAIAFVGTIMGRKVETTSGARTNFYCLGVARSTSGKDGSRKAIKRICASADITGRYLAGEDVSSDSAILAALGRNTSCLFQIDEVGEFLAQNNGKYAASHQKAIATTFTKLFTSANVTYQGKEYANVDRKDIHQPNACVYGTTSAELLFNSLSPAEIANGFLGRMLVFQSKSRPAQRKIKTPPVPANIINELLKWSSIQQVHPGGAGALPTNQSSYTARTVEHTPEADAMLEQFAIECDGAQDAEEGRGKGLDVLWGRAVEHAMKVSLLIACGCNITAKTIDAAATAYAIKLVRYLIGEFVTTCGNEVASNDHQRNVLAVMKSIRKKKAGVTHTQLYRLHQKLTGRQLREILEQIMMQGDVKIEQIKAVRGSPATVYKYAPAQ